MGGSDQEFIESRIPHRPPFLWVDRVLEIKEDIILAEKEIPSDLDLFQGHYPGYPLLPGVLICEAVFQAGAILIHERVRAGENEGTVGSSSVPVLTRILGAKFKREVKPGDRLDLQVRFSEQVGGAWFMKGSAKVDGKVAVQVEFACMRKSEG